MEVFIIIAMSAGLFVSGISLGAYLENRRLYSVGVIKEVQESLRNTREILLPLADKITHFDMRQRQPTNHTLVDYNNIRDPEITLEIPVYEYGSVTEELEIKEEQWLKNQRSWED
jgi:hypothetical protein